MPETKPLLVFGTRPEAIKMAPLVLACQRRDLNLAPVVCLTGQHREMLAQVTDYFGIEGDVHLDVMTPNQTLAQLTNRCVEGIDRVVEEYQPDCIVAQGDTTTAMAAAMVGFYRRLPVVHVEAGLRTGNLQAPWPEEFNRRVVSLITQVHCAPTARAAANLRREGVDPATIHVTGNTVVDALLLTREKETRGDSWAQRYAFLGNRDLVLITGHRRENFGEHLEAICTGLSTLAERFPEVEFIYPVHLNPRVQGPVHARLGDRPNIHLLPPVAYPEFVWLMDRAKLIISDSGGVQEEAPSLKKPVLLTRTTTERPEAVDAGAVELVGTCTETIVNTATSLLADPAAYAARQIDRNPYGDGRAAERIAELIDARAWELQTEDATADSAAA